MTDERTPPADDDRVDARTELLPEEAEPGSEVPGDQARAILEDSEARQLDRDAAPDTVLEHRRSEDTVDPPG